MLEERTKASQREMDMIETLQDLRELNRKHATLDMNSVIDDKVTQQRAAAERQERMEEEEEEQIIRFVGIPWRVFHDVIIQCHV